MASDTERQPAEDTVVVDAGQVGGRDEQWPVAELYRVEPEDGVGEEGVVGSETLVLTAPTEAPPPGRRRLPGPGLGLIAILLAVAAIILAGALLASRGDGQSHQRSASATSAALGSTPTKNTRQHQTDSLPGLEGMTVADARSVLNDLGVRTRVRTAPSDRPRGIVLRLQPRAGTAATPGDVVTLLVSSGQAPPTIVSVPAVVGRTASDATAALGEVGLVAKIHLVPSTESAGVVVRQSPDGAAEAARGSTIRLDVAKAQSVPQRIEVPDLVEMAAADARRQLAGLGLAVEIVRVSSAQPVGTVLRQAPRAGSRLAEKSHVTLTVSSGPKDVTVPDVTGLDEESARAKLEAEGFAVTVTYETTSDATEDGSVVRQTPVGGSSAAPGSVVTIVVAQRG